MGSDVELLDAWRAGDDSAGNELVDRYFPPLLRFFRTKVRDGAEEDLIQRTWLSAVENRDRLRDDASFRGYLFRIARNALHDHYRRRLRTGADADADFEALSVCDLEPTPSVIIAKREQQRLLLRALRRIPLELQLILELFYWEKLAGIELADVLGIPLGTVKSRLRRAKERLREQLDALAESPALAEQTAANLDDWVRSLRAHVDHPAHG